MTILKTITERKKAEIPLINIPEKRLVESPKLSLYNSLYNRSLPLGIIAEVKKASPSRGVITENFHPVEIAEEYERINVSGISVLTDIDFFQGHPVYLTQIKQAVNTPVLRKDFLIDPKQILESERIGADAVLLIAGILSGNQLQELYNQTTEMGMEALVEVHNEEELEKVLKYIKPKLIGVNNRDLHTFETDLTTTKRLKPLIPEEALLISESGVHHKQDVDYLKEAGADGLLIGESLMKSPEKKQFLQSLFGEE
jgi:indole-3-glycerol phosphate synthase